MMSKLNDLYILNGRHSLYICYTSIKLIYKETGRLLWVLWTGRGTYLSWRRREKGQGRESLRSIHRWRDKRVVSHHSYVSNQSILKEINPEYSLEGLLLKLKLQYFSHLLTHWKRPWCWERLKAGGEGVDRGWDGWMISLSQWTWVWANPGR